MARFQKNTDEYCPDTLDDILRHANFEQAFGYASGGTSRRKRLDLLDRIYDLRSIPVHSGPSMFAGGLMNLAENPGHIRVALVADLAECVLLRFHRSTAIVPSLAIQEFGQLATIRN